MNVLYVDYTVAILELWTPVWSLLTTYERKFIRVVYGILCLESINSIFCSVQP